MKIFVTPQHMSKRMVLVSVLLNFRWKGFVFSRMCLQKNVEQYSMNPIEQSFWVIMLKMADMTYIHKY